MQIHVLVFVRVSDELQWINNFCELGLHTILPIIIIHDGFDDVFHKHNPIINYYAKRNEIK